MPLHVALALCTEDRQSLLGALLSAKSDTQSSLTLLEVFACLKTPCFAVMSKGFLLVLLQMYGSQTFEWQFPQWAIFLSLVNKMTTC